MKINYKNISIFYGRIGDKRHDKRQDEYTGL